MWKSSHHSYNCLSIQCNLDQRHKTHGTSNRQGNYMNKFN